MYPQGPYTRQIDKSAWHFGNSCGEYVEMNFHIHCLFHWTTKHSCLETVDVTKRSVSLASSRWKRALVAVKEDIYHNPIVTVIGITTTSSEAYTLVTCCPLAEIFGKSWMERNARDRQARNGPHDAQKLNSTYPDRRWLLIALWKKILLLGCTFLGTNNQCNHATSKN